MLPALSLLLEGPMNSGNIRETGRSTEMRGAVALIGGLLVAISVLLNPVAAAAGLRFSLSVPFCASSWRLFFPSNQSRNTATRPMMAMIPIAIPAFAPVDKPLLEDPEESEAALTEPGATPAEAVLVLPITPVEVVVATVVGAIKGVLEVGETTEDSVGASALEVDGAGGPTGVGLGVGGELSPVRVV
jgi:hypothetical protein